MTRSCNFYLVQCRRPATHVMKGSDGLEWFACDDPAHHERREPEERIVYICTIGIWLEKHGLANEEGIA